MGWGETHESDVSIPRSLAEQLVDEDACDFDHHGGCQAHMYLSLTPGQVCPQEQLKLLLARTPSVARSGLDEASSI